MFNYSVGERMGVVSKLSAKGVACWTTEGELAQLNFSKTSALRSKDAWIDNTFYFSVPDPDVRKQLEAVPPGRAVALRYNQKLFALDLPIPLMCRRRTQFEIVGVRLALANQPEGFPAKPALAAEFITSAPKTDAEASVERAEPASESTTANAVPSTPSVAPISETPTVTPEDEKAEAEAREKKCRAEWKTGSAQLETDLERILEAMRRPLGGREEVTVMAWSSRAHRNILSVTRAARSNRCRRRGAAPRT